MLRQAASLLALPVLLVCTSPLAAAPGLFERADRDSNGAVTPDELPDNQLFQRIDANQDGRITLEEYHRALLSKEGAEMLAKEIANGGADRLLEHLFTYLDRDNDGVITRKEAHKAAWFQKVDLNRDGQITPEEVQRVRASLKRNVPPALAGSVAPSGENKLPPSGASSPVVQNPSETGVGNHIRSAELTTLSGEVISLSNPPANLGTVIAFTSTTCPVSKRYLPTIAGLEPTLKRQGIRLILVDPFSTDDTSDMIRSAKEHGIAAPWIHDRDRTLAAMLGARSTTEVFLLDSAQTLIYRGALDDQYGIDHSRASAQNHYLSDAIESMLAGRIPAITATTPPGCELDLAKPAIPNSTSASIPSYHREVSRILRQHCIRCHHEGGIAPFRLDNAEAVIERAKAIQRVINDRTMPPWFAEPSKHGSPWRNDATLPEQDRMDLLTWLKSNEKPLGDPADAPLPLKFASGWELGTPDHLIETNRTFDIPPAGVMPYQFDAVDAGVSEDRWVTAYEIRPEQPAVVHHVLVRVDPPGKGQRDRGDGTGYWAAYVPGNSAHRYPEGFARKLPAGSRVSFQIHYTPNGSATRDRIRVGLHFAKTPPSHEVKTLPLAHFKIAIPPGASEHVEEFVRRAPFDIPIMGFMPHMHVRGKAFRYEHLKDTEEPETLLNIPRYDFNWQLRYDLKTPRIIRAGEQIRITANYDNSAANRANPDPTRTVKWGEQTTDEMMIGYLEYHVPISR